MVRCFLFLLFFIPLMVFGGLSTQVDKTNISNIEELQLIIRVADIDSNQLPDLSELKKDFLVLRQSQSRSISVINGQRSSQINWVISLKPKRTGKLTIPALHLKGQQSKPIQINVKSINDADFSKQPFFVGTNVSNNNPYVQQQVIYTINLYAPQRLDNVDLAFPLKINNALIVPLNLKQAMKQTTYKGRRVWVKPYQYAIYPQNVGDMVIPYIKQTIQVIRGKKRQSLILYAPEVKLSVKVSDASYPSNQFWLPAKQIKLSAKFTTNPPIFKVGEVVEREIDLTVVGQSKNQLPEISLDSNEAFEQYPDSKKLSHHSKGNDIVAKLKRKVIIVPNQSGEQILPEIRLHWFDTQTKTSKTSVLPAQAIEVLDSSINKNQIKNKPITPKISQSIEAKLPQDVVIKPKQNTNQIQYLWWGVYGLLALWLLTLFICFLIIKSMSNHKKDSAKKIKKSDTGLLKNIKKLSGENQAQATKTALNEWAIFHGFINIVQWVKTGESAQLNNAIIQLDKAIYQSKDWDGKVFYQIFEAHIKQQTGNTVVNLYPQTLKE